MKGSSKAIALCGIMAALSVVLMVLGNLLGIGMYAGPMLAGLCLTPVGHKYGGKYHLALWAGVSILSFILVTNIEQNLIFLCLFGLYPILYPSFQKLPKVWRMMVKLLYFNVVMVALEMLIILILVPETMGTLLMIIMLLMGNFIFLCYDFLVPRAEFLIKKYLGKLWKYF